MKRKAGEALRTSREEILLRRTLHGIPVSAIDDDKRQQAREAQTSLWESSPHLALRVPLGV
jgi:hypothetical protein